jgi:hypothetical protein
LNLCALPVTKIPGKVLSAERRYRRGDVGAFLADGSQQISFIAPITLETIDSDAFSDNRTIIVADFSHCPNFKILGGFAKSGIQAVNVPLTLEEIADFGFNACSLRRIDLSRCSLRRIGNSAFHDSNIEVVALPEGLREIGSYAFAECPNLTKLVFPSSLESIGEYAFCSCDGLRHLTFSAQVSWNGEPFETWYSDKRSPSLEEVTFIGMDTSKLLPAFANAIVRRDWIKEEFPNQITNCLNFYNTKLLSPFGSLTPAEIMALDANLRPKLQRFVGSAVLQKSIAEMNAPETAKALRDEMFTIFWSSLREVVPRILNAVDGNILLYSVALKVLLSHMPSPIPTTVFSETVSFFGCGARPLHAP